MFTRDSSFSVVGITSLYLRVGEELVMAFLVLRMAAWMWNKFSTWFWDPYVWLPPNYNWEDLVPNEKVRYANWSDLWTYPIVMALIAIPLRFLVLNNLVYCYIAQAVGLRNVRHRPVVPNETLEQLFSRYKAKLPDCEISRCASVLGWSQRKVERWIRQRTAMTRITKFTKFMECAWQCTYYTFIFIYGLYVMFGKSWMWDILHCWYDYPNHSVDDDVWWYYMMSLAFYWSMTFTHFFEIRRKDFWQMFFHHLVTIALITFSWTCNLTRIGTLVLIVHDCADIPLQLAKMSIYSGHKAFCDAVFAVFAVMWIVTRVGIYPIWILYSTAIDAPTIVPMFPAYYIFNGLLFALLFLHVYWTYLILRIIATTITKGSVEDNRSSSDPSEISDDEQVKKEM
ncbi:ceramide synthase 6-like [Homarus americanus]|uniref:Ceramide synthase 6-like 2 n=1 Tax=Homarus americanus TaxID=6706 RepID=A0A8J5MMZ8_HOMAM|nr:ceramide synthase 6-like [Homarus americanus]KAG7157369.1 Ceramide synthase 6-like 2 [Homarus americanus]